MSRGKTLLHLTPLAAIGGCETNCLRVIEGLPQHRHRVLVFDEAGPMSARWRQAGAKVEHLAAWRGGARDFESALARWAKAEAGPDGIIYWSTSRMPPVLRALQNWVVPWVVHLGNPASAGLVTKMRRRVQELVHDVGRKVTLAACSRQVAKSYERASYFRKFPIQVIHNAVVPMDGTTRTCRPLPPGSRPRVGMVARLDGIKDHLTLIRAIASISKARPDVILELAGDGDLRPALEQAVRRLGLAARVNFLGFTEVPPLLASWDIYVHSTTAAEGMGTAVAEAMMAGLPCVVSDLAVMREVCGNDGAEFARAADATALGRALHELMADQSRRKVLGEAAQARARQMFSLQRVADEYLRLALARPTT